MPVHTCGVCAPSASCVSACACQKVLQSVAFFVILLRLILSCRSRHRPPTGTMSYSVSSRAFRLRTTFVVDVVSVVNVDVAEEPSAHRSIISMHVSMRAFICFMLLYSVFIILNNILICCCLGAALNILCTYCRVLRSHILFRLVSFYSALSQPRLGCCVILICKHIYTFFQLLPLACNVVQYNAYIILINECLWQPAAVDDNTNVILL